MKKLTLLVSLALVLGLVVGCPNDTPKPEVAPSGDYTVTVVGGSGSGSYDAGTRVTVRATTPDHQTFTSWSASTEDVIFADKNANETSFLMPAQNVTITANVTNKPPVVNGVTITPTSATVAKGNSQQFTATVDGLYPPEGGFTFTWTLSGHSAGTTISPSGLLNVNAGETATQITVRATSVQNTSRSASATVNIANSGAQLYTLTLEDVPSPGQRSSAQYAEGATVSLTTNQIGDDYRFESWSATAGTIADNTMRETNFTMPASNVTISANYETIVTKLSASIVGTVVTLSPDPNGTTLKSALDAVVTDDNRDSITEIHITTTNGAKIIPEDNLHALFSDSSNEFSARALDTITGLQYLDTSNVTNMGYMFYFDGSLTDLDLSSWDISNVTDMQYMFWGSGIDNLNLNGWDTSKIPSWMDSIFATVSLESVTVGSELTQIVSDQIKPRAGVYHAYPGMWVAEDGSESATIPVVDGKAVAGTYTAKLAD